MVRKAQDKIEGNNKQLSSVVLSDSESVWMNESKSIAYFCKRKPLKVDKALIAELKKIINNRPDKDVRLCLHESPDADFHEMIILGRKDKYYRAHKHLKKGESYHIMEGSMAVFIFNEDGRVVDTCLLEPSGNLIYKVGVNMYHTVMPLSNMVIYHESKPGPFMGEADSIFPVWAPDENNLEELTIYTNNLLRILKSK